MPREEGRARVRGHGAALPGLLHVGHVVGIWHGVALDLHEAERREHRSGGQGVEAGGADPVGREIQPTQAAKKHGGSNAPDRGVTESVARQPKRADAREPGRLEEGVHLLGEARDVEVEHGRAREKIRCVIEQPPGGGRRHLDEAASHPHPMMRVTRRDQVREGVYVRRRDTSSWLNTLAGGRVFPGLQSHAQFTVRESGGHFEVALKSDDGVTSLAVIGDVAADLPVGSVFGSLGEASACLRAGAIGYSAMPDPRRFQGMELRCDRWAVEPLTVSEVRSSCFDDVAVFPAGSITFDCALLMRGIDHEWHGRADICCQA